MAPHPLDEPSISDDAALWRRIHPKWWVFDAKLNGHRVSSQAFQNSPDGSGTSVVIAAESTEQEVLAGYPGYGLAQLTAGQARQQNQGVRHVFKENVRGHAQIEGTKTKPVMRELASQCVPIVPPTTA